MNFKKIKKRLYIGLFFILMGYSANILKRETKIREVEKILDASENNMDVIIQQYLQCLEKSSFNEKEKAVLLDDFIPYLREYGNLFDKKFIANILSSTESTLVFRKYDFSNSTYAATYSNIINFIPFGNLFTNGVIFWGEDYSKEEFKHEYIHSIQSWNNQKYVYAEAYASFNSGDNYSDLQAIFTMIGDLGNKELLSTCLANGTMEEYWEYLSRLYKDGEIIKRLRKNIENVFYYTYKSPILLPDFQNYLRSEVLSDITNLYSKKYSTNMVNDKLYQILSSIYLLEKKFVIENNSLLESNYVYSYYDEDGNEYFVNIDSENRFNNCELLQRIR